MSVPASYLLCQHVCMSAARGHAQPLSLAVSTCMCVGSNGPCTIVVSYACFCRESLQDIEARLLAAEEAARLAKDAVQGQADIAKLEREKALAARAEAEQANKNLDSARSDNIMSRSKAALAL